MWQIEFKVWLDCKECLKHLASFIGSWQNLKTRLDLAFPDKPLSTNNCLCGEAKVDKNRRQVIACHTLQKLKGCFNPAWVASVAEKMRTQADQL